MQNSQIILELRQVLQDMDFFNIYHSSNLRVLLNDASTDGDRIRVILRDSAVQEYLFPDYRQNHQNIHDPVRHYVTLRKNGKIPPR